MRIYDAVMSLQVPRVQLQMAGAWQGCHEVWSSFQGKPRCGLSRGSGLGLAGELRGQTNHAIKPPCLQQHTQLIVYITLLAGLPQCFCFGPALSLTA